MSQDMDWDDIANMWWSHFEDMQTTPSSEHSHKRGRSSSRTPVTRKRRDRAPSRAKGMQPRKLTFSSARTRSRSRSPSLPRKKVTWGKAAFYAANKGKSPAVIEKAWRKTPQGKRNQSTLVKLKLSKVRHNLTRKNARKIMPRGKPYTRRTTRKPKGAYRGALMPKWAKGETKHSLCHDGMSTGVTNAPDTSTCAALTKSNLETIRSNVGGEQVLGLGTFAAFCMNPVAQGTEAYARNGRSIDGTYLRIQGHIRNRATSAKAYVRMLVLAVKGGQADGKAKLSQDTLFKKIDGTIVGFSTPAQSDSDYAGSGAARVRSLQLPVNKSLYTVLADQKMQLAGTDESFGSSDRLFDLKMKLKQRTKFFDGDAASFESNQIVFVVMTVDPTCADAPGGTSSSSEGLPIEFESKYSFKDF